MPEIEALAENPTYNAIRGQWYSLRKQWQAIARDVEIDAELRARYDAAAQKLEAQEQVHRDAKGQQQVENLQRLQALVQKFETRAAAESPHAQAGRSADEGRQAGGRHHGPAPGQAGSRRPDGAAAGGAHRR